MGLAYRIQLRIRTHDNREFLLSAELPKQPYEIADIQWTLCGATNRPKSELIEISSEHNEFLPCTKQELSLAASEGNIGSGITHVSGRSCIPEAEETVVAN